MREIYLVAMSLVEGTPEGPEAAAVAALRAALASAGVKPGALDELRLGAAGPALPPGVDKRVALAAGLPPRLPTTRCPPGGAEALFSLCEAISGGWCGLGLAIGLQAGAAPEAAALGLPDPARPAADPLSDDLAWRLAPTDLAAAAALLAAHAPLDEAGAAAWAHALLGPDADPATLPQAAPIAAGASACLLASAEALAEHKLQPIARIVSLGLTGADPALWPMAAAAAAEQALHRLGFAPSDLRAAALDAAALPALVAVAERLQLPPHRAAAGAGALGPRPGGPRSHLGAADPLARLRPLIDALEAVDGRFGLLAAASGAGVGRAFVLDREFYV
jgi:acetyl-CoA acetyltransferase